MKNTSDVWFMAFLMSKGYKIERYQVIARGRIRAEFTFSDAEWQSLKLEFNNGELVKYKALIDQIKDLSY